MKKIRFSLLFASISLCASISMCAQVPQKMSYQAVLRDATNELLTLRAVGMRISITHREINRNPIYVETQYTNTNINGVVSVQIGQGGVVSGSFSAIDWANGPYFIKTETDPNGGSDYQIVGSSELLSVPFALFALNSQHVQDDYVKTSSLNGSDPYEINLKGGMSVAKNVTVAGNLEALGATSTLGTNAKPFKGLFLSSGSLSIASDTLGQNVPAAILSNVAGNLQISAGGLKLMGDKTSFFAPNFVGKLNGNASTATKLETPRTINGLAFDGTKDIVIPIPDTLSLSRRINLKLEGSDTLSLSRRINLKLEGTDTLSLSRRINTKLAVSDTTALAAKFYRITNPSNYITAAAITGKLNTSDTTAMLNRRFAKDTLSLSRRINTKLAGADTLSLSRRINTKLAGTDTLSLSRRINTKLAVSDTTALAAKFYRITNPSNYITAAAITGKLNTSDTTAMLNRRFAKDTLSLSRRINTKLAGADTLSLSRRINKKLASTDTLSLSNRINLKLGRIGNQTLSGNLVANEVQVNTGYTLRTPSVSFPDGTVQTSASKFLSTLYTDGGGPADPKPLDLSISVHKLADSYFFLKEGTEGQLIYIVPNGRSASAEDIHIIIERSRKWVRGRLIELEKIDWQPFFPLTELPTIVSALFTDGAWNVSAGTLR